MYLFANWESSCANPTAHLQQRRMASQHVSMWILMRNFRCGPTEARLEMQTCPRPSPHVHMGCGYWISVKKSSSLRQNTLLWTNSIMQGIRGKVGDASSWTFPERPAGPVIFDDDVTCERRTWLRSAFSNRAQVVYRVQLWIIYDRVAAAHSF
jgi:hypothetical protein